MHIPLRGADTYPYPYSYCYCDSYTHANHYTNTDRNSNCDCDDDPYCNSYPQANAYTKSCSDAAAAAHRATASDTRAKPIGEHRFLSSSRRQPADEQFQGRGRAKAANVRRAFRLAAEKNRLAARAPPETRLLFPGYSSVEASRSTLAWRSAQKH
jgi:hypothetical protein